jgi:NADH:ubiquinone oxidoreductase subunit
MSVKSVLGALSPVHIFWSVFIRRAKFVGNDVYGNRYYIARPISGYRQERRWVLYNGTPDASKVPPEWHGWLHHQTDEFPLEEKGYFRQEWQKPHVPNLTGTDSAYRPPGSIAREGKREKASGDYEAWTPPQ